MDSNASRCLLRHRCNDKRPLARMCGARRDIHRLIVSSRCGIGSGALHCSVVLRVSLGLRCKHEKTPGRRSLMSSVFLIFRHSPPPSTTAYSCCVRLAGFATDCRSSIASFGPAVIVYLAATPNLDWFVSPNQSPLFESAVSVNDLLMVPHCRGIAPDILHFFHDTSLCFVHRFSSSLYRRSK